MPTSTLSTAAAAQFFLALTLSSPATVIPLADELAKPQPRVVQKTTTRIQVEGARPLTAVDAVPATLSNSIGNLVLADEPDRPTTSRERLIGEFRRWSLLKANWDGEGSAAPAVPSLKEAVAFARLLDEGASLPEPMLLSSGHAGLFWNDENLYADLEFLGDGQVAYYIERQGDKHKGDVKFDSKTMPAVFTALLEI